MLILTGLPFLSIQMPFLSYFCLLPATVNFKATLGTVKLFSFLPVIIDTLLEQGYELVTVSDLVYDSDYTINNNGIQIKNN